MFKTRVVFDAPSSQMVLSLGVLDKKIVTGNEYLREFTDKRCNELLYHSDYNDKFLDKVRSIIIGSAGCFPKVSEIRGVNQVS